MSRKNFMASGDAETVLTGFADRIKELTPEGINDKQNKTLENPLTIGGTEQTTVEGALGGLNGLVPSNASSSNQLISTSSVPYINQTITNVADVNSFGASLQAYGAKSLAGKTSINGQWYDYVSTIQGNTASGGSWVGNAILWGSNGDFYTLRKGYSSSTTWTISKHVKTSDLTSSVTSGSSAPVTSGGVASYLAGTPTIGVDTIMLGQLGLGDTNYNKLNMRVVNCSSISGTPLGSNGQGLYAVFGVIEFAVGPISTNATSWKPNTICKVRVNHAGTYGDWTTLT